MYNIDDLIYYKSHGICRIDQIVEQNFSGTPQLYYVMQSKLRPGVTLYHPVESKNSQLEKLINKEEALEIIECFENDASEWEDRNTNRQRNHSVILGKNDHLEIAQLMNTLLRKEIELNEQDKKLAGQDTQMLQEITMIIYDILELAMKQPKEQLEQKITQKIQHSLQLATS